MDLEVDAESFTESLQNKRTKLLLPKEIEIATSTSNIEVNLGYVSANYAHKQTLATKQLNEQQKAKVVVKPTQGGPKFSNTKKPPHANGNNQGYDPQPIGSPVPMKTYDLQVGPPGNTSRVSQSVGRHTAGTSVNKRGVPGHNPNKSPMIEGGVSGKRQANSGQEIVLDEDFLMISRLKAHIS